MVNYDEAISDLKDELLLTDSDAALQTIAFAYELDVSVLKEHAVRELGDISTYAERVGAAKAQADRATVIAEHVEAEASLMGRVTSLMPKRDG